MVLAARTPLSLRYRCTRLPLAAQRCVTVNNVDGFYGGRQGGNCVVILDFCSRAAQIWV